MLRLRRWRRVTEKSIWAHSIEPLSSAFPQSPHDVTCITAPCTIATKCCILRPKQHNRISSAQEQLPICWHRPSTRLLVWEGGDGQKYCKWIRGSEPVQRCEESLRHLSGGPYKWRPNRTKEDSGRSKADKDGEKEEKGSLVSEGSIHITVEDHPKIPSPGSQCLFMGKRKASLGWSRNLHGMWTSETLLGTDAKWGWMIRGAEMCHSEPSWF